MRLLVSTIIYDDKAPKPIVGIRMERTSMIWMSILLISVSWFTYLKGKVGGILES
jgi:hypothetical protein